LPVFTFESSLRGKAPAGPGQRRPPVLPCAAGRVGGAAAGEPFAHIRFSAGFAGSLRFVVQAAFQASAAVRFRWWWL